MFAHYYIKFYNPQSTWLQSRNEDGTWKDIREDWREASFKAYFWMVPHDLKTLIDTLGGKEVASKRLDDFFGKLNANYGEEWFAAGNEPDFQSPWIYNWTSEPYKSQLLIRRIVNEQFSNRDCGLPGNDDMGAMGAWYVWANLGLYPMIPGVGGFAIHSPSFSTIRLHLQDKIFEIRGGSESIPYIHSLDLDGTRITKPWLDLEQLLKGKVLNFLLTDKPDTTWGVNEAMPSFENYQ